MRLDADKPNRAAIAWIGGAAFMAATLVAVAPAFLFDDRLIDGAGIWEKPAKFSISLGLHFATLAILVGLVPAERRGGFWIPFAALTSLAAGVFEIVYIAVQAARGRASHFNYETSFESAMYGAMGVGAVLLILAAFIVGLKIWRSRGLRGRGVDAGAAVGLPFGAIMTLIVAGYMSASGSHFVDAPGATDADGLFLFGWSTTEPDIRVSHFFATHLMQAAPVAGWLGDRISPAFGRLSAIATIAAFAAISLAAFLTAVGRIADRLARE